jgi:hypothetical protein
MKCNTCSAELIPVFEGIGVEETNQFDNALVLHTSGGYGMFIDNMDEEDPTFVLCHECAHLFCAIFDPEKKLIDSTVSHGHGESPVVEDVVVNVINKSVSVFNTDGECVYETENPTHIEVGTTFVECTTADNEGSYTYIFPVCNVSEIRILEYNDD